MEESKGDARTDTHTVNRFTSYIETKSELYEATQRNGYYLPAYTSSIITEKYLLRVIKGKVYCPKYQDVKMRPCPRKPSKDFLLKRVDTLAGTKNLTMGFTEKHLPDKNWLITLIATLDPTDIIFDKSFVPPPKEKTASLKTIELPHGFLSGLPGSKHKAKAKRLTVVQQGRMEQRITRMTKVNEKLAFAIVHEKAKLEQLKQKSGLGDTTATAGGQIQARTPKKNQQSSRNPVQSQNQ